MVPVSTRAYLQLVRPANVVTAAADILAGYAAVGRPSVAELPALVVSGMALYAGGVVLNDVFDRELDARERPERPIPRGAVPTSRATALGASCLAVAIAAAFSVSAASGVVAAVVAGCAVAYDASAKHQPVLGPAAMGMCRGGNLLLGITAAPMTAYSPWHLALLPIGYVAALTMLGRGEVTGGRRTTVGWASTLIVAVVAAILMLGRTGAFDWRWAAIPLLLLVYRIAPALWRAFGDPSARNLGRAVRAGVLSLVVVDASIAAGFAGPWYGAGVLALLGVAVMLARAFAVT